MNLKKTFFKKYNYRFMSMKIGYKNVNRNT